MFLIVLLYVIKKKEPLPLRGSTPSTYTVDSPRDATDVGKQRLSDRVKKGSFWVPQGPPQKGALGGVF